MFLQQGNLAVAFIPRCGTRTLWNLLPDARKIDNEQVTADITVAFVDDWRRRFRSAYSHLRAQEQMHRPEWRTYPNFVDWVIDNDHKDSHVIPQWDLITLDGELLPDKIHLLSDLDELWRFYGEGTPPHLNAAEPLPINPYRRSDLEAYYAKDDELLKYVSRNNG